MLPATSCVLKAESSVLLKPSYHNGDTSLNYRIAVTDRTFSDGGSIFLYCIVNCGSHQPCTDGDCTLKIGIV